ncbi:hypothetical protein BCR39DRAFT_515824 [Naematelia encephala]|uniref:Uncharacterized protein n=1 Tax=Naematelia encephala TaxID=71784 RepID=A0A1Y2BJN5_9TREE|nr:hypothetical protein BCR39DRAFT_515824 [Naematelia encephala]
MRPFTPPSLLLLVSAVILPVEAALYNVTPSDQSPLLTYLPSRSGPSDQTWNVSYTSPLWSSLLNETIGQGISQHYTTHIGANVSVSWLGTAAYVYGLANSSDVKFYVDGNDYANAAADEDNDGDLSLYSPMGSVVDLEVGWHTLTVEVVGDGGVSVSQVTLTVSLAPDGSAFTSTVLETLADNGTSINEAFNTSEGAWEMNTSFGYTYDDSSTSGYSIETHTPYSKLSFASPANTSLVALYGPLSSSHSTYSVSLSPASGDSTSLPSGSSSTPTNLTFDASTPAIVQEEYLYVGVLDPEQEYIVTVEVLGGQDESWNLATVQYYIASEGTASTSPSNSNHRSRVLGIALGVSLCTVGIALICIGIWRFCIIGRHRKEAAKAAAAENEQLELDLFPEKSAPKGFATGNLDNPSDLSLPVTSRSLRDESASIRSAAGETVVPPPYEASWQVGTVEK